MANRKLRKLANFRMLAGVLIIAALAPVICAQAPRQLQIEVGANQQISILARDVSYGEVLRALERKLGWEMEIPPLADELKLSYVRAETTQPQTALAQLLEGSRLGYAFLGGVNTSKMKVIVIPLTPREATVLGDTTPNSPIPDNAVAGSSLPLPAQAQPASTLQPNATAVVNTMAEQPEPPSTRPLAEAINAIGVPPGVSPADVGKTTTMPLPTGPGKHP